MGADMNGADTLAGRDLYFRRVYGGKRGPVLMVRVWDAERFMDAERDRGTNEKNPADRYGVVPATRDEYLAERS